MVSMIARVSVSCFAAVAGSALQPHLQEMSDLETAHRRLEVEVANIEFDDSVLASNIERTLRDCIESHGETDEICVAFQIASDYLRDIRIGLLRDSNDLYVPVPFNPIWHSQMLFPELTKYITNIKVSQFMHSKAVRKMETLHMKERGLFNRALQVADARNPAAAAMRPMAYREMRRYTEYKENRRYRVYGDIAPVSRPIATAIKSLDQLNVMTFASRGYTGIDEVATAEFGIQAMVRLFHRQRAWLKSSLSMVVQFGPMKQAHVFKTVSDILATLNTILATLRTAGQDTTLLQQLVDSHRQFHSIGGSASVATLREFQSEVFERIPIGPTTPLVLLNFHCDLGELIKEAIEFQREKVMTLDEVSNMTENARIAINAWKRALESVQEMPEYHQLIAAVEQLAVDVENNFFENSIILGE